mmetsp:Transcript_101735/g.286867  ORF Transcript_101735/g.286867 Transcript_101735/m.286867 type:complete len:207 (-) Transcript_101735:1270-1890(-)
MLANFSANAASESAKSRSSFRPQVIDLVLVSRLLMSSPVCLSKALIPLFVLLRKRWPTIWPVSHGFDPAGTRAVQKQAVGTGRWSIASSKEVSGFSHRSRQASARSFCGSKTLELGHGFSQSGSATTPLRHLLILRASSKDCHVKQAVGEKTSQPCENSRTFSHVSWPWNFSAYKDGSAGASVSNSDEENTFSAVKKATCGGAPKT